MTSVKNGMVCQVLYVPSQWKERQSPLGFKVYNHVYKTERQSVSLIFILYLYNKNVVTVSKTYVKLSKHLTEEKFTPLSLLNILRLYYNYRELSKEKLNVHQCSVYHTRVMRDNIFRKMFYYLNKIFNTLTYVEIFII